LIKTSSWLMPSKSQLQLTDIDGMWADSWDRPPRQPPWLIAAGIGAETVTEIEIETETVIKSWAGRLCNCNCGVQKAAANLLFYSYTAALLSLSNRNSKMFLREKQRRNH